MIFDYRTLKQAAESGQRLGNWNGKAVFAASTTQLQNFGTGAFYILYDDENKIVAKTQSGWRSYGEVNEAGNVSECTPTAYRTPAAAARKTSFASGSAGGAYAPGYDRMERPTGDVKLGIDVEKVLKTAREMSVESLLDGFLPGVDFNVAKG